MENSDKKAYSYALSTHSEELLKGGIWEETNIHAVLWVKALILHDYRHLMKMPEKGDIERYSNFLKRILPGSNQEDIESLIAIAQHDCTLIIQGLVANVVGAQFFDIILMAEESIKDQANYVAHRIFEQFVIQ